MPPAPGGPPLDDVCHDREMDGRSWGDLAPCDAEAGAWIAPILGTWGTVGAVVGEAFEACAVVPHEGTQPEQTPGEVLSPRLAAALRSAIGPDVGPCVAGLWEGYGGLFGGGAVSISLSTGKQAPVPAAFPRDVERRPRLQLPHRAYLLFRATLEDLDALVLPHQLWEPSPDLFWPTSREWLVAGDTDLVATFVGGPRSLVERVLLGVPGAEPVDPAERLLRWDEWTLQQGS